MRGLARLYLSLWAPRVLVANAAGLLIWRLTLGFPSVGELGLVAAIIVWWSFQEWWAHRWLLHMKPVNIGGRRLEFPPARIHRAHHARIGDPDLITLPTPMVIGLVPVNIAAWWFAMPSPTWAVTAMWAYASCAVAYEWTHLFSHTDLRPRSRFAQVIQQRHLLHHRRSANNWYGFTIPWVDDLLGTAPSLDARARH